MICPRCADEQIEVMAKSPVKDVWTVYQCQHCLYTWRDTEPLRRTSREHYPEAFRMTQKDIDDAPMVPSIPPLLVESGVGKALANMLQMIDLPLLPAAFIISLALRASQGSATVAILTTGGLLSEAVMGLNPIQCVLVTLAACFGGLGASHINDSGFWIVTKYLGLSVADGLKTWTVLTTILGFTGFLITWCVWAVI